MKKSLLAAAAIALATATAAAAPPQQPLPKPTFDTFVAYGYLALAADRCGFRINDDFTTYTANARKSMGLTKTDLSHLVGIGMRRFEDQTPNPRALSNTCAEVAKNPLIVRR